MQTLLLTFVFFAIAVGLMTVMVLVSGRSLKGSCGGPICTCVKNGEDIGSCEIDSPSLPVHPQNSQF
jgi:hypothetical protein